MANIVDTLFALDEGAAVSIVRACWTCGWEETRQVTITEVDSEPGDEATITRQRHVEAIIERLESLDTAGLEEVHTLITEDLE